MRYLTVWIITAALLTGCTKQSIEYRDTSAIPLAAQGRSVEAITRAPIEGALSASNTLKARVVVSATTGDYTALYADGTMTFDGSTTVPTKFDPLSVTGVTNYPASGSTLHFWGLYPDAGWSTPAVTSSFTFTGKEDVMNASEKTGNKNLAAAGTHPALAFEHLLTLLEIEVVAADAATAATWGELTQITLTGAASGTFPNSVTVSPAVGTAPLFSGSVATWSTYCYTAATPPTATDTPFSSQSLAIPTASAKVAYTMTAPITATGTNDYTLSVTTQPATGSAITAANIPINLKTTLGAAFTGSTAGKKFTVRLTFRATSLQAIATLTPWSDGGGADVDVDFP